MTKPKLLAVTLTMAEVLLVHDEELLEFLKDQDIKPGMARDYVKGDDVLEGFEQLIETKSKSEYAGGVVANTVNSIAKLGSVDISLVAITGDDEIGEMFKREMENAGIIIYPTSLEWEGDLNSAIAYGISLSGGNRSFVFKHGNCNDHLKPEHITQEMVEDTDYIMLDGYLFETSHGIDIWQHVESMATEHDKKLVITLSGNRITEGFRELLQNTIKEHADIIFGNADEFTSLYEAENLDLALDSLKSNLSYDQVAFLTDGSRGAYIVREDSVELVKPPVQVDKSQIINATGAGDAFAAGALNGLINGYSAKVSAKMGSFLAAAALRQEPSQLQDPKSEILKRMDLEEEKGEVS